MVTLMIITILGSHLSGHYNLISKKNGRFFLGSDEKAFIEASIATVESCEMYLYSKADEVSVSP